MVWDRRTTLRTLAALAAVLVLLGGAPAVAEDNLSPHHHPTWTIRWREGMSLPLEWSGPVGAAASRWERETEGLLGFVRESSAPNLVRMTLWPADVAATVCPYESSLACSWFVVPRPPFHIGAEMMDFNPDFRGLFSTRCEKDLYDVETIAIHEWGHFAEVRHTFYDYTSAMWPVAHGGCRRWVSDHERRSLRLNRFLHLPDAPDADRLIPEGGL